MLRQIVALSLVVTAFGAEDLFDRGLPRIYEGERLGAVAMPIGGIGTGTVWLSGRGTLSVWQIFNNLTEVRLPDTFLAVRARAGGEPVVRVLATEAQPGFPPIRSLRFRGEYPIATLQYDDPDLPVAVSLEAYNPMIPLETKDSALPCAIFELSARNRGTATAEVAFAFAAQNPVGYDGQGTIEGRRFWGYGANRNALRAGEGSTVLAMGVDGETSPSFANPASLLAIGRRDRALVACGNLTTTFGLPGRGPAPATDAVWIEGASAATDPRALEAVARIAASGGGVLLSSPAPSLLEAIAARRAGAKVVPKSEPILFEDFEKGTYEGWTVEGTAFGTSPHTGTTPGQQVVSGFLGKRLVNTFLPNDQPQGRLLSRPFTIERRFIGFLIGGGSHEGRTCIQLLVGGKVARSATGKDNERLEPAAWDVSDLIGREARIEIVDRDSGPWGHINIDQIIFSDDPPQLFLAAGDSIEAIAKALPLRYEKVETIDAPQTFSPIGWEFRRVVALAGASPEEAGFRVLVRDRTGTPIVLLGPFGKGKIALVLAENVPTFYALGLLGSLLSNAYRHGEAIAADSPLFGELAIAVLAPGATGCARWTDGEALARDLADDGRLSGPSDSGPSPAEETHDGAVALAFSLGPGESRTVPFLLAWFFPNLERFGHKGNKYADWFGSARDVVRYVEGRFGELDRLTRLYRDTVYASGLPYWFIDAFTSQSCIFRGVTCFWARKHKDTGTDYFAGYEGCYGCCPLNCTHVWNYAQTHAFLYPEIGRNLRRYDFLHYLREDGETQHRQHSPHNAFIDGHCAVIEAAYREHRTSPDGAFLHEIYPKVRSAIEWLIRKIDPDEDGVNAGHQWNTYDVATGGAHTFIGSQYLSALAAGERMALIEGDAASAARWRKIREAGSKNQDERLWNGEYWIQIPDPEPARDYNTGCHSDQLLGQWWSHILDCGYLYPRDRIRKALDSIFRYNFRRDFRGFRQAPRRYVIDDDAGLLMCTWPKGGRPNPFILYADEVWTGIEYEVAALMIYEGMLEPGFAIAKAARDRYDGRVREGLNSGPGGNPFNELECGKFYARALSSWSLLLASQGFVHDGPGRRIGFRPRVRPDDHASFFCAAEGWGLFAQRRQGKAQRERIEVRHGRLRVRELLFEVPAEAAEVRASIRANDRPIGATVSRAGSDVTLTLGREATIAAGEALAVDLTW